MVKILSGLDPEIREISATIRARDSLISYEELFDKLLDHELFLKHEDLKKTTTQVTAVVAQRIMNSSPAPRNNRRPPNSNYNWRAPNKQSNQNANPHWRNFPNQSVQPHEFAVNYATTLAIQQMCLYHITSDNTSLHNVQDFKWIEEVTMGNGNEIPITQT
uniref:Uncharacterized protein n=1 Tax=Nicotiana tabacum TaxID=4097 RepID=A0A1S3XXQ0_TOBAC